MKIRHAIILLSSLSIISLFCSCTMTMNMIHTAGEASDVVDETTSQNPTVSPTLSIPASLLK